MIGHHLDGSVLKKFLIKACDFLPSIMYGAWIFTTIGKAPAQAKDTAGCIFLFGLQGIDNISDGALQGTWYDAKATAPALVRFDETLLSQDAQYLDQVVPWKFCGGGDFLSTDHFTGELAQVGKNVQAMFRRAIGGSAF